LAAVIGRIFAAERLAAVAPDAAAAMASAMIPSSATGIVILFTLRTSCGG
jgi:predicted ATPase